MRQLDCESDSSEYNEIAMKSINMNLKFLTILLFVIVKVQSQEIVGSWKVTTYETKVFYFNNSTSQLYVKDLSKSTDVDTFLANDALKLFHTTYTFYSNGTYRMISDASDLNSNYLSNKKTGKITLIDHEQKNQEYDYAIENNILFMTRISDEGKITIGLERKE
ncbi:MAG: hypothetical protein EOP00_29380 [Pedobacter sp.]|nr:MAG: hypothetical protein EOP00_29380 [Pedobacter sp.]